MEARVMSVLTLDHAACYYCTIPLKQKPVHEVLRLADRLCCFVGRCEYCVKNLTYDCLDHRSARDTRRSALAL